MADNSFKIKNSLVLTPVDLATLTNPQAGDLACDINDSNKIKRYDAASASWTEVGSGAAGDVDTLLVQDFDTASLSTFTQTGLTLITTNPLDGRQSARLIHDVPVTGVVRSFKQTIAVPPKFRGVNMTASLTLRSTASQGNVTIQFRDETNSVDYPSQQLQTNSQVIASLVTNSTTTVSGFTNANINTLSVGESVTGSGIPTGTTIAAINTTALTITLSQAATASATVSLRFSDLPRTIQLGFNIPANCSSYSYTISALQESGSPETYVDDIVLKNYWLGMSNQGQSTATLQVPAISDWITANYTTLAWQGIGTISSSTIKAKREGGDLILSGTFVTGSIVASEVQIPLPLWNGSQLTIASSGRVSTNQAGGRITRNVVTNNDFTSILSPGQNYFGVGLYNNASFSPLSRLNGNNFANIGETISFENIRIPIDGWAETQPQSITTTDLVPAKAVLGNTSLDIPNVTAWQGYTPTFQGFGTPTNVEFEWRQVGEDVEVRGKFASGTPTAVEARVGLPAGLTSAGTTLIPSIQVIGKGNRSSTSSTTNFGGLTVLIEPSVTYFTFGNETSTANGSSKVNADTILAASQNLTFFAKVPCAGLSAVSTKTIGTTQSGIVQQADSYLNLSTGSKVGTGIVTGFTATNLGSAFSYNASTGEVTVLQSGIVNVHVTAMNNGAVTNSVAIYINGVSAGGSTHQAATNNLGQTNSISYKASVGDIITMRNETAGNINPAYMKLTLSGSLKQVAVSADQKITIPTSELRMEGASTRGSTATAIVRFDTTAKLRGDAFTVESDSVLGTRITMKKAGRLNISVSLDRNNGEYKITRNQSVLTSVPSTASEVLACSGTGASVIPAGCTVDVAVGDIIRVAQSISPNADTDNSLSLHFQEQDIAVSVTNTLPQFSESDSSVRVDTANGYGSTGTKIRRFSNVRDNIGTDIAYNDGSQGVPAQVGDYFVVKSAGIYHISYTESFAVAAQMGITKNQSNLTSDVQTLPANEILATSTSTSNSYEENIAWSGYLNVGDIIRAATNGGVAADASNISFTISKVGKPNVTGVNVTPFVNVPQPEIEAITHTANASTLLDATSEYRFALGNLSTTNKGIIRIEDDVTNTRTKFVANKRCTINLSCSASFSVVGWSLIVYKNGSIFQAGSTVSTVNFASIVSSSFTLETGEFFSIGGNNIAALDPLRLQITAEALSDQILTAPETFSTDTASLRYANASEYTLSTLANAPIGTYITFTYAANTNNRLQTDGVTAGRTRPTQTDADMNVNGMLIYSRAYNAASSGAQPAAFAIQIGKGLKGVSTNGYRLASKVGMVNLDYAFLSTTESGLSHRDYNEVTGVLYVDNAWSFNAASTTRIFRSEDLLYTNTAYITINASKSPALTGVPLVQPRIATLKDVRTSGTSGPAPTAGSFVTRTINNISDPTGIVTSLASSQFTLPAGEYYIEGKIPAWYTGSHKARLRNVTDGTDAIVGTSAYDDLDGAIESVASYIEGSVVLNSAKTFEIQHRAANAYGSGFGTAVSFGVDEVYLIVKITKIK